MTGRKLFAGIALCVSVVFAGCGGGGEGTVRIRGTVVDRAGAVTLKEHASVEVTYKDKDGEKVKIATVSDSGFQVDVPAGTEVRVIIKSIPVLGKTAPRSTFGEEFAGKTSPLIYKTTTDGTQDVEVNLATKSVSKKT